MSSSTPEFDIEKDISMINDHPAIHEHESNAEHNLGHEHEHEHEHDHHLNLLHGHRGRRLLHFILPDGRHVHVVPSPQEVDNLKRRLSSASPAREFDIHISGSPEHVQALRQVHEHHEDRRRMFRAKDPKAWDEMENVRIQLDVLSAELHNATAHNVQLDANFTKYGYSANLRTKDSPNASSANSLHDSEHESRDWDAERHKGTTIMLWRKPNVRQFFHKGLLWRASETEEVTSFELFVDLLFVGILAINGDTAGELPTGRTLLIFCVTFIPSWKVWSDMALIISWFESGKYTFSCAKSRGTRLMHFTDDVFQRLAILFTMSCLVGYTVNMVESFDHTWSQMIAFYVCLINLPCNGITG
jgi:Bacterial low temperature requirement A protein (LtrA)